MPASKRPGAVFEAGGRQTSASSSSPRLSFPSLGLPRWLFSRLRTGKSKVVSQVDLRLGYLHATYVQGQCRGSSVGSLRSSRKKALGQVCRNGRSPCPPCSGLFAAALVIGLATTALTFGFDLGVALDLLRASQSAFFVAGAPALASIAFIMLYAAAVAISLPGVAILTVIGVICSAGGTARFWCWSPPRQVQAAFLLTRRALGDPVRERAAPAMQRFAEGFRRNALSYGFALNVVPIFPYALIIVVPAACGVPLHRFWLA